jgi:AcrR family transcriptional regulator
VSRWIPGAKERLQAAAFEVISRRGFEAVTVAEIAAAAGVTERTFFRHFADKREVLFGGEGLLVDSVVRVIADVPAEVDASTAVRDGLRHAAEDLFPPERKKSARARGEVLQADPGLIERESLKMRSLSSAIAEALRARGTTEPQASLLARASVGVFEIAFGEWIADPGERTLAEVQDAMFDTLGSLLGRSAAG